jgi:hypothetical protein
MGRPSKTVGVQGLHLILKTNADGDPAANGTSFREQLVADM